MTQEISEGVWQTACDSYGRVRHSRKYDCVYTNIKGNGGDRLVTVAARIENNADAQAIAAVPLMLRYLHKRAQASDREAIIILDAIRSNAASCYEDANEQIEKPWACSFCEDRFVVGSDLMAHNATMHNGARAE
jgi:hypothetical protein